MKRRPHRFKTVSVAGAAALVVGVASLSPAAAQSIQPDQQAFRDLYREMVETNTVSNIGSCTKAAEQVAKRLKAAGYSDSDITLFAPPGYPRDGGIVASLKGSDPKAQPMLLLAHIDVVAAKREDWTRDPFKLIEENGFFYGRGTIDDKSHAAIWADMLIRFKQSGFQGRRTIKMALTCGEESDEASNGAKYLAEKRPELIAAQFAFNEGGGGKIEGGKRQRLSLKVGEKASQNFTFTATNPGGHSSQPAPANAIYELGGALRALQGYTFPIKFTDTTRITFTKMQRTVSERYAEGLRRILADPSDKEANAIVSSDRAVNSMLRTTCVATVVKAGHAENALPQRAAATVNCRIFPGETVDATLAKLQELAGDKVKVTANGGPRPLETPPPYDQRIIGPIEQIAAQHFPGVPMLPIMTTAATDAVFMGVVHIPVYGVPGIFTEEPSGIHGFNERIPVASLYDGRDYLFDVVKALANTAW